MKRNPAILAILLFLLILSGHALQAEPLTCPFTAIRLLIGASNGATGFYGKIAHGATLTRCAGHPRWNNLPLSLDEKRFQVELDMERSMSAAIMVSIPDGASPMRIKAAAAEAFAEAISSDLVLNSSLSLEDLVKGFGYLASRMDDPASDTKLAELLRNNRNIFADRPEYHSYNESHLLRDAKYVFEGETSALEAKTYVIQLASQAEGMAFELRVAAARKLSGENLLAMDADIALPALKKADLVTNQGVYNIGLNVGLTINNKLNTPAKREAIADAVIYSETQLGVPYRFVAAEGNPSDVTAAFNLLNAVLAQKGSSRQFVPSADMLIEPLR